jgi:hypothetical protein
MGTTRLHPFRTVIESLDNTATAEFAPIFDNADLGPFAGQQAGDKKCFTLVPGHALSKSIKVVAGHAKGLLSRNATVCRVELRHNCW